MCQSAWAQSQPKLRESVESYTDLTPLHSCTFASLFSVLSRALDHPSNAFALAQVVPQNRVAFDTFPVQFLKVNAGSCVDETKKVNTVSGAVNFR